MDETAEIELLNDEKVIEMLESKNYLNLAKFISRKLCYFTENDEKYIDLFWDSAFNKNWISISEEIVNEQFGYAKSKDMMPHFYKKLIDEFEENVDYKQVDKERELVKKLTQDSDDSKYFIIAGDAFKSLLHSSINYHGRLIRKYFIKVESLCEITTKLILTYPIYVKQKKLDEIERRTNLCTVNANTHAYKKKLSYDESIYIVSTLQYAQQGLFKVGRTTDIKSRSSPLYTINADGVKINNVKVLAEFKVHDAAYMEHYINTSLKKLRHGKKSEFFMCPYNLLYDAVNSLVNTDCKMNIATNDLMDKITQFTSDELAQMNLK